MNEAEENAFRIVYQFYSKWRETVIETQEQWDQFSMEVGEIGRQTNTLIGWNLLEAALDTFTALYKDGMKPMPAGYFGRDDLST